MRVIIICPYPAGIIPSQRFRFEQYETLLQEAKIYVEVRPFFSIKAWRKFSEKGLFTKSWLMLNGFLKRIFLLFNLSGIDRVFIHREAAPLGPPLLEYVIAKVLKKKIIYDFDDAIWLTDNTRESPIAKLLRCRWKTGFICRWSHKISCGNPYLAAYARQFNPNVLVNPTTLDIETFHKPVFMSNDSEEIPTIGWTGSRSTLKYLKTIIPALQILERKYSRIRYLIIADEDPKVPLQNAAFLPWNKETEIDDLGKIDIGIMPLPDDSWTRGKCGFKALQYMAVAIPAVVSPVGINTEIVQHNVEGFWCTSQQEWFARLEELILDPEKRTAMGKRGREKVVACYSVDSNVANFLSLFA